MTQYCLVLSDEDLQVESLAATPMLERALHDFAALANILPEMKVSLYTMSGGEGYALLRAKPEWCPSKQHRVTYRQVWRLYAPTVRTQEAES